MEEGEFAAMLVSDALLKERKVEGVFEVAAIMKMRFSSQMCCCDTIKGWHAEQRVIHTPV